MGYEGRAARFAVLGYVPSLAVHAGVSRDDVVAMTAWFAVHTNSQQELVANQALKRQGFKTLFLHFKTTTKHAKTIPAP